MARSYRTLLLPLAVLALTCLAGWWFKAHCVAGGWTDAEQYTSGCYSDAVPFWGLRGVAAGELPYFEARMEYPVLTGALIWGEGWVARALGGSGSSAAPFLAAVTFVNALLAMLLLWRLWRAGLRGVRLWGWAAAPTLVLYLGHNWDMLAVSLTVFALLAAREGQLVRSGMLAALGVAAKLFPILLLPLLGLQALFGGDGGAWRGRLLRATRLTLAAVGAWLAVNLPVALLAHENWSEFYRFSGARSGTIASIWELAATAGWGTTIPERNLYAAVLFVLGFGVILAAGRHRHRDRLWVLMPPVLAWFMLTNKVYSPQFDLWLYPLLLMFAPRLLPVALFALAGVAAYFAEFWWFAGNEGASPSATTLDIALAAGVRGAAMLWLIVDAVRLPPPDWVTRQGETPSEEAQGSGSVSARS